MTQVYWPTVSTTETRPPFPAGLFERSALLAYRLLWLLAIPLALLYLWYRGRKEPLYRQHIGERWGFVHPVIDRPIWVHSASLGELRGAAPLIRALLAEGHSIWITTLTPAGRLAAQRLFADEIRRGRVRLSYAPIEWASAVARFIDRVRPHCAIMTDNDTWPVLLSSIRAASVPLCMANAQYSGKSLARDMRWGGFRSAVFRCYDLVLCKSGTHADRFRTLGCRRVEVAGETRFDYPIPQAQLDAAAALIDRFPLGPAGRPVIALASIIEDEEETILSVILSLRAEPLFAGAARPLFVYVPRQPKRFDVVASRLHQVGLKLIRRSRCFDDTLRPKPGSDIETGAFDEADVLLGDSLGEMFFYLALAEVVVVGGSFSPLGAHNVIEPMALAKPVLVGPVIWTIEFPAVEAIDAGALQLVDDAQALGRALMGLMSDRARYDRAVLSAARFHRENVGSTARHMAVLKPWLQSVTRTERPADQVL